MPIAIDKPSKYFTAKTYTGTGSTQSITGLEFSPDWVWIKDRTNGSANHNLFDVLRTWSGDSLPARLYSNTTDAEESTTYLGASNLTAFNSNGFTLGSGGNTNTNTNSYVAWCWDANGAGSSNTAGTISSTVSANTTSGFSIVSYTSNGTSGATVGHGLGVAPSMIIVKRRSSAEDWGVGHKSLGWTKFIRLNTTGAEATSTGLWNDTAPSSTVVTLGNSGISNVGSGTTMIMYCFAEVKGFSKAFSYTGNGSSDGTFVYCGFTPAFIMMKRTDASGYDWGMMDNKRDTYNETYKTLWANLSNAEYTTTGSSGMATDFLSNGFKMRGTNGENNASGANYIGIAFASNPFVSSKGVAVTAR